MPCALCLIPYNREGTETLPYRLLCFFFRADGIRPYLRLVPYALIIGCGCPARHIGKANTSYAAGILHSEATSFAHCANFILRSKTAAVPCAYASSASFTFFASVGEKPFNAAISLSSASRIFLREPKCFNNSFAFALPIPSIDVRVVATVFLRCF